MHRGHHPRIHTEGIVQHLHQRNETVGGATGVGHYAMLGCIELGVIHAVDEGGVGTGCGSRNDDHLCAGIQMGCCLVAIGEEPGGFDDDVDTQSPPRQVPWIPLRQHLQRFAVDHEAIVGGGHRLSKHAHHRVVLEQVRHGLLVTEVVHRHHLDVGTTLCSCPPKTSPNAAETVDTHAYSHAGEPSFFRCRGAPPGLVLHDLPIASSALRRWPRNDGGHRYNQLQW